LWVAKKDTTMDALMELGGAVVLDVAKVFSVAAVKDT
jgi:alcohol dehydrogenase YqhD (iron-dependent ADH family)